MIHTIETISLIEEIKTDGHSPMKFICSDGGIYCVKYRSGKSFNKNELVFLLYEILCSQLLQNLHIPTHAFTFGGMQSIGLFSKNIPTSPVDKVPYSPFFLSLVNFLDKKSIETPILDFIERCKNLSIRDILDNLRSLLPPEWYILPNITQQIEDFLTDYKRLDNIQIVIKNSLKV